MLDHPIVSYEVWWPSDRPKPTHFDDLAFRNETCCIANWYSCLLNGSIAGATPRLFIDLNPSAKARRRESAPAAVSLPFDYEAYFESEAYERKRRIAITLRDGLHWLAKKRGQDATKFNNAYEEIQKQEFIFRGQLKKNISSPTRKLTARIDFVYDLDGARLTANFTKHGGRQTLTTRKLGCCPPHPWLVHVLHKSITWKGHVLKVNFCGFRSSTNTSNIK